MRFLINWQSQDEQGAAMPIRSARAGVKRLIPLILIAWAGFVPGQNVPPPNNHVAIPNPTPRDPDLKQVYENDTDGQKKAQVKSIKSQLLGREVWLESNQILLLAQQLEQEIGSAKKSVPMSMNAAKVAKIEKLAHSVEEKMKSQ